MGLPPRPALEWRDDGVAHRGYGDVYSSRAGAYAQAQTVFLEGCRLPEAWSGRSHYVILELGFGFGSNFLATLMQWSADPMRSDTLDYIAIEAEPVSAADLERYHTLLGSMPGAGPLRPSADSLAQLCRQWPVSLPGVHALMFASGKVRLLLFLASAASALRELESEIDAVYLDGFAPRANPEMWSLSLLQSVRARLVRGARLATYSAASEVRRALESLGFEVERRAGFAGKRECLAAVLTFGRVGRARESQIDVAIIGAGVAAASCAWRLRELGIGSVVYSGGPPRLQPAAVVHPELWHEDDLDAQWHSRAFLSFRTMLAQLEAQRGERLWHPVGVEKWCPVVHASADAEASESLSESGRKRGTRPDQGVTVPGLIEKAPAPDVLWRAEQAGWLVPRTYLDALWATSQCQHLEAQVADISLDKQHWRLRDASGNVLGTHRQVLVATGAERLPTIHMDQRQASGRMIAAELPLHRIRGQSEEIRWPGNPAQAVKLGGGYRIQVSEDIAVLGASFVARSTDLEPNVREQQGVRLAFADYHGLPTIDAASLQLHTGVRATGVDRRPYVGPWPVLGHTFTAHGWPIACPGLFACLGLGSRGFTSASLASEAIAAQIAGRVLALPKRWRLAVDPGRLLARQKHHFRPLP